jgi:hypothetical protein
VLSASPSSQASDHSGIPSPHTVIPQLFGHPSVLLVLASSQISAHSVIPLPQILNGTLEVDRLLELSVSSAAVSEATLLI